MLLGRGRLRLFVIVMLLRMGLIDTVADSACVIKHPSSRDPTKGPGSGTKHPPVFKVITNHFYEWGLSLFWPWGEYVSCCHFNGEECRTVRKSREVARFV